MDTYWVVDSHGKYIVMLNDTSIYATHSFYECSVIDHILRQYSTYGTEGVHAYYQEICEKLASMDEETSPYAWELAIVAKDVASRILLM